FGRVGCGVRRGEDVGHQPRITRLIFARDDDGFAHRRMAPEYGFNFTQLDAVAAELHLIVEAAEEFNLAVRAPASPVAGPVKQRGPPGPRFPVLLEIHAFLASGRFARTWLSALRFAAER